MKQTLFPILLALSFAGCASTGAEQSEQEGENVAAEGEEEPRMRCYRERGTGMRLSRERICVPIDGD